MAEAKLIVGLGNPGAEYENTRHNLGFLVLDYLARELDLRFERAAFAQGMLAKGRLENSLVYLLKPLTYMNNSGTAVKGIIHARELALEDILIVCDDFSLSFGQLRLRPGGSDGGHNGLSSVIGHLASRNFARLRMGIGSTAPEGHSIFHKKEAVVNFVLGRFTAEERKGLDEFLARAAQCCLLWISHGAARAMEAYNKKI